MNKVLSLWRQNKEWVWQAVLVPFCATRLGLLVIGHFAQMMVTDPVYPYGKGLGGRTHLLDIWNRWDGSLGAVLPDLLSYNPTHGRNSEPSCQP